MPSTTKRQGVDPSSTATTTTSTTARNLDRREHSPADDDHLQHITTSVGRGDDEDDEDEDDYTSSSGSSDSDSDSDDDEEQEQQVNQKENTKTPTTTSTSDDIPRIPAIPKPRIHRINKNPDLLSRLSAFLPQMKSANERLEQEIAAGRAKDVRLELDGDDDDDEEMEGKRYIEMNLGLGVLEEKRPGDDDEEDNVETKAGQDNQHVLPERPKSGKDSNVLDTLMGNTEPSAEKEKPTIEEI
ncbi:hypothetical protein AbraIFM66950_005795 [Aspergillus brasiliensis]|nr:hypothetical protein AbraIFM66950_005795 [Aspergillus brasiliensis]